MLRFASALVPRPDLMLLFSVLILASVCAAIVPPFQSPDEFSHVERAYLLSKGQLVLEHPPNVADGATKSRGAGGKIDTGLLSYFDFFQPLPFHRDRKISRKELEAAAKIKWSGKRAFADAAGTGYYFPAAYAPQAIGLSVGRGFGWTVDRSYRLARALNIAFSLGLIILAAQIFAINPAAISLLIIPMSIFQLASASLDSFTTALSILCASIYMRLMLNEDIDRRWSSYGLAIAILVLTTSRNHLLPLVLFPLTVYFSTKDKRFLWQFIAIVVLTLGWLIFTLNESYVVQGDKDVSNREAILFYLSNPISVLAILSNTIQSNGSRYAQYFVGVLGWLDASFSKSFYNLVFVLLLVVAGLTVSIKSLAKDWQSRLTLLIIVSASAFIVFFASLVTWNPLMPTAIVGVQGRHFIVPAMLLTYALAGAPSSRGSITHMLGWVLTGVLAVAVAHAMPQLLVDRYFMVQSSPVSSRE